MDKIDTIIVAAGSGKRLGHSVPKAFTMLCGKPLFCYALDVFAAHPQAGKIVLVVPREMITTAAAIVKTCSIITQNKTDITSGGEKRHNSVQNGLALTNSDFVLIHDAARPFVTAEVIDGIVAMKENFDGAITATPMVDTIREVAKGGVCGKTLDRSKLMRVGTPQMFKRETLIKALGGIEDIHDAPTDEAALFESLGIKIAYVWGDPLNFKITTPSDFEIATALINQKKPVRKK